MTIPDDLRRRLADFRLGAPVHTSDGRHIGSLHRLVVDRESWEPRQLVVKETARFNGHLLALAAGLITEELVVPMSAISRISRERVDLAITSAEARRLPPYLSYSWAPLTATGAVEEDLGILLGAARHPVEVETAAKSTGDIEIRPDENVMLGHEGRLLGHVRDVLFDDGELTGVVVHTRPPIGGDVVIQLRFLERSDDGALFVRMTDKDLERLQPFVPEER
jgi:sporulation protein YlmC with PRC-barrel domain